LADPIAFRAYLKQTGQPVRLHSEGGGTLTLEFSDSSLDDVMTLYKALKGVELYIVATPANG
jgi:hypothetical protein